MLPSDLPSRETFPLEIFALIGMDKKWPWKILWSDEAHFHSTGYVKTHNCQMWATENQLETQPVPLHPARVTIWCSFAASFIIGRYLFLGDGCLISCHLYGHWSAL